MQRFQRAVWIAAATAAVSAAASPPDPNSAPLGGSYGQTMRIMVSAASPPDPCMVAVGFRTGEVQPPEPDRTFNLAAGQTGFYDLSLNRLAGKFGVRVEVRPRVVVMGGTCSASAEVYEVFSGRTTAFMRLFTGATPPDPNTNLSPPDPNFAELGAVTGQIVRLGVARGEGFNTTPPDPCRGVMAFLDMQGNVVGGRSFDLLPGQTAFLDVDPAKVGATLAASRVTLRPRIMAPPVADVVNPVGGNLGGCLASVQIYESSTGWSTEAISGR